MGGIIEKVKCKLIEWLGGVTYDKYIEARNKHIESSRHIRLLCEDYESFQSLIIRAGVSMERDVYNMVMYGPHPDLANDENIKEVLDMNSKHKVAIEGLFKSLLDEIRNGEDKKNANG